MRLIVSTLTGLFASRSADRLRPIGVAHFIPCFSLSNRPLFALLLTASG